jgi:hypothetical protein
MSLVTPIVAGTAAGLGITLVVAQVLPKPPPELRSAVARLNSPLRASVSHAAVAEQTGDAHSSPIPDWLLSWFADSGLVRARSQDLAILGKSREQHITAKILTGLLGVLFAPAMMAVAFAAGIRVPIVIPAGLSVILGAICFFGPDAEVKSKAEKARTEFTKILHSYLVSVALERRANRGILQALEEAAAIGDSWVLHRIRSTLLAAQMSNLTPWQALEELGTTLGVVHLAEAAQTMRSASQEGTAVFARLLAQAESLGDAVLAEERAVANERSERMIIPVSAMAIVIIMIMAYPLTVLIGGTL